LGKKRNNLPISTNADNRQGPRDPGLAESLHELHGFLDRLAETTGQLREKLIGPVPTAGATAKAIGPPSIDELAKSAATKAACLCGEAETINQRL